MKKKPKVRVFPYIDKYGVRSVFYQPIMDNGCLGWPFKDIDYFLSSLDLQKKNFV